LIAYQQPHYKIEKKKTTKPPGLMEKPLKNYEPGMLKKNGNSQFGIRVGLLQVL
jgi:hypothetical protein